MILIGQYDSSFVRRVAIAMRLYDLAFEHRPWSVFGDAEKIRAHNPLVRVPTLVLDDGTSLGDSHVILDYLDGLMPPQRRLYPQAEPERHRAMRVAALATGLADKAVSLFYEKHLHSAASAVWEERCRGQIAGTLAVLEEDRASRSTAYWFGDRIGHADIAVAAALRHAGDSHPDLVRLEEHPALQAHAAGMEALPLFREISQPFIPPA
jgi:glutathione S-transferase